MFLICISRSRVANLHNDDAESKFSQSSASRKLIHSRRNKCSTSKLVIGFPDQFIFKRSRVPGTSRPVRWMNKKCSKMLFVFIHVWAVCVCLCIRAERSRLHRSLTYNMPINILYPQWLHFECLNIINLCCSQSINSRLYPVFKINILFLFRYFSIAKTNHILSDSMCELE